MKIEFNRTGADRKALVQAAGEILGVKPKYLGMPTAAYEVGCFRIDRNGTVEPDGCVGSREIESLLERLAEKGIAPVPSETAQEADTDALAETVKYAEGPGNGPYRADTGLTVAFPRESFTDAALENLHRLVEAKGRLIKKALGAGSLPIEADGEKVSFPWFSGTDSRSAAAYTHFISALCDMARKQKRVTAKEKPVDNEKYAFRCFLLRLGFIGAEYREERKVLLKNLSGSSAFKNGGRKEAGSDEISRQGNSGAHPEGIPCGDTGQAAENE